MEFGLARADRFKSEVGREGANDASKLHPHPPDSELVGIFSMDARIGSVEDLNGRRR